jgi:hypothetical protein
MADQTSAGTKKVLMLTNKDHGQSNCFLATAHALATTDPSVEVHFATFKGFDKFIAEANEHIVKTNPSARPIVYQEVQGMSMAEGLNHHFERLDIPRKKEYLPLSYLASPLTTTNTLAAIRDTVYVLIPYSGPQIVEIYNSIVAILEDVKPDLIVLDCLFTPGLTALTKLGLPYICLSPNTCKDFSMSAQTKVTRMKLPG